MAGADSLAEQVRGLIRSLLPADAPSVIDAGAELGENGLGLDSVGLVDLLCACEERFEVRLPAEILVVEDGAEVHITVATLIDEVSRRIAADQGSS